MRETFSSVPTAHDASLSLFLLPYLLSSSLFLSHAPIHWCVRACVCVSVCMYVCMCVCAYTSRICCTHAVCPSTESSSVTEWGGEDDEGQGGGATVADGPPETLRAVNLSRR